MSLRSLNEVLERYPLTCGVLTANVLLYVFAAYHCGSLQIDPEFQLRLGGNLYSRIGREPWRLLTSAFLHFDPIHVIFNCLVIGVVGRHLELHFGSARLAVIYLICAVVGSASSAGWHALNRAAVVSAGASGAACGLVLLGYVYGRMVPERLGVFAERLQRWILWIVVFTVLVPGVDWAGHAGGAAAGAVLGRVVVPKPGDDPHPAWAISAIVGAILALACIAQAMLSFRHG